MRFVAAIVFEVDGHITKMSEAGKVTDDMKRMVVRNFLLEKEVV